MEEIWKKSEFGCGNYEFSNMGRVRNTRMKMIVKGVPNSNGYLRICNTRTKTRVFVHREVARLFLGECPEGCVVNHINGNQLDNRVENLEYVSQSDNMMHAVVILGKDKVVPKEKAYRICEDYKNGMIQKDIATKYGVCLSTVGNVLVRHGLKTNNSSNRVNQQPSHDKYRYERFND